MDSLHYWYGTNNNRLTYIDDSTTVASATYPSDLEDQASGNYSYHPNGNLWSDVRDSITYISWNQAQKIGRVEKTDRLITFKYDPMQNRVAKYSKPNASTSEKRTYYVRDAQGNVMATYSAWVKNNAGAITWDSVRLTEQHIYGSARVGMALTNVKLYPQVPKNPHLPDTSHYAIFEGWKRYEITNHLGNVLAVITDRKRGGAASGTAIQWFDADVVASQQYYPFGMLMPGNASTSLRRQYTLNGNDYRYGFNGKEGDDEVKGDDNQQDYGMRIYDPRVGRFLSVDPIAREFPMLTPYQFASNRPIDGIDLDGLEVIGYTEVFAANQKYGKIKPILDANEVWNKYMRETFASTSAGETFSATVDGKYASIPLIFGSVNAQEDQLAPQAATSIILTDSKGGVTTLDNYENNSLEGATLSIRVLINSDPKAITTPANTLLTIPHEVVIHAESQAELIIKYNNGEITFEQLKEQYKEKLADPLGGHGPIVNKSNEHYEGINDENEKIIDNIFKSVITKRGTGVDCCGIQESDAPEESGTATASGKKARDITIKQSDNFRHERNRERNQYDPEKKVCQCNDKK
jgi:RHS repeat-associated protein